MTFGDQFAFRVGLVNIQTGGGKGTELMLSRACLDLPLEEFIARYVTPTVLAALEELKASVHA